MTDKLKQTIKEELAKLPKEKQYAINAVDWIKISEEITKKYPLNENEVNNLQVETLLVLMGIVDSQFYAINIENQVGTTKDCATQIADEVVQKIFIPIANIGIENVKKNLQSKKPNYNQTVNFILSGGNYSAFVEEKDNDKV